jgi:tRNA-dihydrouridine synthase
MGNPWLLSKIAADLDGMVYEKPSLEARFAVAEEHFLRMIAEKGDRVGLAEGKKHMSWYIAGLNGAASARARMMEAKTHDEVLSILRTLFEHAQNGGEAACP